MTTFAAGGHPREKGGGERNRGCGLEPKEESTPRHAEKHSPSSSKVSSLAWGDGNLMKGERGSLRREKWEGRPVYTGANFRGGSRRGDGGRTFLDKN